MFKFPVFALSLVATGYASILTPCADSKCTSPFVNDTLLDSASAMRHDFWFKKDAGEMLGVAAVKLQLNGKARATWLGFAQEFYWKRGEPVDRSGSSNYGLYGELAEIDGFRFIDGGFGGSGGLNSMMAISRQDVDTLTMDERTYFAPRIDTAVKLGLPAQGDTLIWSLSLIYFHASEMDMKRWTNGLGGSVLENGDTISWEGSDTVTVRFRTIMRDYTPRVGLQLNQPIHPAAILGQYDLQGRPLAAGVRSAGLIFERTPQGFRKRLQLR